MSFVTNVVLLAALLQGADTPEKAIEGFQKAVREKNWDAVYDGQSPSERRRLEEEFKTGQVPHLDRMIEFLELTREEILKLSPREVNARIGRKLNQNDPDHFALMAQAKFKRKRKEEHSLEEGHRRKSAGAIPGGSRQGGMGTRQVIPRGSTTGSTPGDADGPAACPPSSTPADPELGRDLPIDIERAEINLDPGV